LPWPPVDFELGPLGSWARLYGSSGSPKPGPGQPRVGARRHKTCGDLGPDPGREARPSAVGHVVAPDLALAKWAIRCLHAWLKMVFRGTCALWYRQTHNQSKPV
jgi:hypothetical protein